MLELSSFMDLKSGENSNKPIKRPSRVERRISMTLRTSINNSNSEAWKYFSYFGKKVFGNPLEYTLKSGEFKLNTNRAIDFFLFCLDVFFSNKFRTTHNSTLT